MGLCQAILSSDLEKRSREIDRGLTLAASEDVVQRVLLAGPRESGKSTVMSQMRLTNGVPFPEGYIDRFTAGVHGNVIEYMKIICEAVEDFGFYSRLKAKDAWELVMAAELDQKLDAPLGEAVKELWADRIVKRVWEERSTLQIVDAVRHFFDDIDRVSAPGYLVTTEDILHVRTRTSGTSSQILDVRSAHGDRDSFPVEFVDVGGQRGERKKWIQFFADVHIVLFVVAISDYDRTLEDDDAKNRLIDAEDLFGSIINSSALKRKEVVLFLNKTDVFAQKV